MLNPIQINLQFLVKKSRDSKKPCDYLGNGAWCALCVGASVAALPN